MTEINLNLYYTMATVVIVYVIGQQLVKKFSILRKYCIPAPVVGGLLFAIINTILTVTGICSITIDTSLQSLCMLMFYVSVGLGARWKVLKTGGIQVVVMLIVVSVLCIIQSGLGVAIVSAFGLKPLLGTALGSIPMVGGNATAASFGPTLESLGVENATVVASAAATYGLVAGCMIGGPIARHLINKKQLAKAHDTIQETGKQKESAPNIHSDKIMPSVVIILLLIAGASIVNTVIASLGIVMNMAVGAIIAGAILRNTADSLKIQMPDAEIDAVCNVGLYLFLCMAMINLQLWKLVDLAVPMIVTLLAQTVLMIFFAMFVIYNIMGRDYEAAVMASGVCGFGMGATPNAIANMEAVSTVYGPAPRAFLVVPIIGSMLADIVNALILTAFFNIFS